MNSKSRSILAASGLVLVYPACFTPNQKPAETEEGGVGSTSEGRGSSSGTSNMTSDSTSVATGEPVLDTTSSVGGAMVSSGDATETEGVDSNTTGGDEEATDAETTASGVLCASECVPPAPDGWFGPYVQASEPGTPDDSGCGDDYPSSIADGFSDVTGSAASCGCSCGSPSGGECEDPITIQIYDQDQNGLACSTVTDTISTAETPFANDVNGSGINVRISEPDVAVSPVCDASATESIGAAGILNPVELCGGTFRDGDCDGDAVCVPDLSSSFVAAHCIYAEEDIPCPAGSSYTDRSVYFSSAVDSRDCSTCSCGAAQNTDCDGTVTFFAAYLSGGLVIDPAENEPANGLCRIVDPNQTPAAGVTYGIEYEPEEPTSSGCAAQGGSPIGGVSGQDEFTVCCTP